ncbi:MAG: hypothetical protein IPH78_02875 [Bacteroidetes bacterium]|nr:hypothetical protein [Bacteroidota bacterium]MBK8657557.1 hypothetical protein [Bacteroidota bacterium]
MVKIEKDKNGYVFRVLGLHKFWAMKDTIVVPFENIKMVHTNVNDLPAWKGWRLPGTHLPFVITAGSYYRNGIWTFWDVSNRQNVIIVELKEGKYARLVVEVEDVQEALQLLRKS